MAYLLRGGKEGGEGERRGGEGRRGEEREGKGDITLINRMEGGMEGERE